MPHFQHGAASIYYEERGAGFPVLLLAPGGLESSVAWWARAALDPLAVYRDDFHLVAMDQRNAGSSTGPLDADDPWGTYVGDQLALMDHLGHERFHVIGCCIGCSYALGMIERAPDRVASAVLEQPIGVAGDNLQHFRAMWREWADRLLARRRDLDPETMEAFGARLWRDDFVFNVSRDAVRACRTPLLVLPGIDVFHPGPIGHEIAELAPDAEVVEPWKDTPEHIARAVERTRQFLREHTPA